jgi:Tfp pilus assembly protein PilF
MHVVCVLLIITATLAPAATFGGQPAAMRQPADGDRERARIQSGLGWEYLRKEQWAEAARSFQRAIEIDPTYQYAYYGLGRAELGRRQYAAAILALEKCAALYRAEAGRQFSDAQDAQRYRRERLIEIDEQLRQLRSGPPNFRTQDLIRQLEDMRRELNDRIERGNNMNIATHIPPFVSLSLGSAYFRSGRMVDAEREYKAAIAADPKAGEAHSNLAVVYMETGRLLEAEKALAAAKRVGFRVNPQLEEEIRNRKRP